MAIMKTVTFAQGVALKNVTQGATLKGCEQRWECIKIKRITQKAVLGLDSR